MYRVRKQVGLTDRLMNSLNGAGVAVAVLDTGIGYHPDFDGRILAFRDFLHGRYPNYDDSGHGTHVAGCIAGSGFASNGKNKGMSPNSRLIIGKVLNHQGDGNIEEMINGIEWVLENKARYNIRILNISIGMSDETSKERMHRLLRVVDEAWCEGLLVVCAAGNTGPDLMTLSPLGALQKVVTVGCNEAGYFGNRKYLCEHYSGRGPSPIAAKKPDIVAPGTDIISCNLNIKQRASKFINAYVAKSGTSMSTPIVSGALALLLQKYPYYNNEQAKRKLLNSAVDLKQPFNKQGHGLLNVGRMLNEN
ncbi:MAG: S8 family peptidase [Lachnospiraceae bacterium]|nr:S8 family peptidase [Lachnospiraceae bacterium]